jgi:hypothetical protein
MEEKQNSGCLSVFVPFLLACFAAIMAAWFLKGNGTAQRPVNDSATVIPITLRTETTTRPTVETTTRPTGETTTEADTQQPAAEEGKYHYRQLNTVEKDIYNHVRDAVEAGKTSLTINNVDAKTYVAALERGIYAFVRDYPLYFWLREGYETTYITRSGINMDTVNIDVSCFGFRTAGMATQRYQAELQAKVQEIAAQAENLRTDYEKALFVHDYLVTHTEYDTENYEASKNDQHAGAIDYIFTAYGCLIQNKCVCEGYAKAYKLILDTLGIECVFVSGTGNDELHAWNLLQLEGEYYWVDVTWDDPGTENWPNEAKHVYFCMTDKQIGATHKAETEYFTVPVCTADKYNYYVYNDLMLTSADEAKMAEILNRAPGEKLLEFGFTDAARSTAERISNRGNLTDVPRIADSEQYWYLIDDENNAVLVHIK